MIRTEDLEGYELQNLNQPFSSEHMEAGELVCADGSVVDVHLLREGECVVAVSAPGEDDKCVVFVDDRPSFAIEEHLHSQSPVIHESGYIASHLGEHREEVFTLITWHGEIVLQRIVEVARKPKFTRDGSYVAFWRLTDKTVYIYDVENAVETGRFNTNNLRDSDDVGRAVNIGIEGGDLQGTAAFKISDTYGRGPDDALGWISPDGSLIEGYD